MAGKSQLDQFDQFAYLRVAGQAVAGPTQVLARLTTGLSNLQKVGWAVSRVEYFVPEAWYARLTQTTTYVEMGISASGDANQAFDAANPSLQFAKRIACGPTPAAMGGPFNYVTPEVVQMAAGHETLLIPQNIYLVLGWLGAAALTTDFLEARLWYREIELGPEDWYDLLQLRLPLGL